VFVKEKEADHYQENTASDPAGPPLARLANTYNRHCNPGRSSFAPFSRSAYGRKRASTGFPLIPGTDKEQVASIGAFAIAPCDSDVLYVGTGEQTRRNGVT
jgi:hypothetical protein